METTTPRGRCRSRTPISSSPGGLQTQTERALISGISELSVSSSAAVSTRSKLLTVTPKPIPVLPSRPNFGKNGEKIELRANHYLMKLPEQAIEFYQYELKITQDIIGDNGRPITIEWTGGRVSKHTRDECKEKSYKIFYAWVQGFMPEIFLKAVYDRQHIVYLTVFFGKEMCEDVIVDESTYKIQIKLVVDQPLIVVDKESLRRTNFEASTEREREPLHILDLLTNQTVYKKQETKQSNYTQHGRSFFQPMEDKNQASLPMGRELRDGFQKSLRFVVGDPVVDENGVPTKDFKISMNIETKKSPFFLAQPLHLTASQTLGFNNVPQQFSRHDVDLVRKHIYELRCKKTYNGRNFTISGVSETPARDQTFSLENGEETTVERYFWSRYQIKLQYPLLPCVKGEQQGFVPMELCMVLPNQKVDLKKLTGEMSSQIIRVSAVAPEIRMGQINEKSAFLSDNNADKFLQDCNIERSKEMMKVQGRVLPAPTIVFANNNKTNVRAGSWIMGNSGLIRPATVRVFTFACFINPREASADNLDAFASALSNKAGQLGMQMPKSMADGAYLELDQFKSKVNEWQGKSNGTLDLIICILGQKKASKMKNDVKFVEKQTDVATQCILLKTLQKYIRDPNRNKTLLENLVYKINQKMDGSNNEVDVSRDEIGKRWLSNAVMYIGMDVNHPPPMSKKEIAQGRKPKDPSVVGFVANSGKTMGDYRMWARVQDARQEIIDEENLHFFVKSAVKEFEENKFRKPSRVVVYRDGVSESQFGEVQNREILAIKTAMADFNPKLTFITVQKRHNTRFFSEDRISRGTKLSDKNIPAGTAVDTGPVHPFQFDFFLASHAALTGTTKASYYVVLHNESADLDPDALHHVTYLLCHLYQRAMKSVSLPAPCYFAHHAATRGKELYSGYANVSDDSGSGISSMSGGSGDRDLDYDEINRQIAYSTQFHSRKMFLLIPLYGEKADKTGIVQVDITINDEPVEDLFMKLDDSGEAYFVEDTFEECEMPIELATSPLPNSSAAYFMSVGLANLHKTVATDDKQMMTDAKSRSVSPQPARKEVNLKAKKKLSYAPEIKTKDKKAKSLNKMISVDDEIGVRQQKSQKRKMTKLIRRENNERFRRERLRSSSWHSGGAVDELMIVLPSSVEADDDTNVVDDDDDDENVFVEKSNRKKLSKLKLIGDSANGAESSSTTVDESGRQTSGVWATPSEDIPSSSRFTDAATGHDEMFQLEFGEEEAEPSETAVVKNYESNEEELQKDERKSSGYNSECDTTSMTSNQSSPVFPPELQQKQSKSVTFKAMDEPKEEPAVASTSSRWGISNMLGLGFMYRSTTGSSVGSKIAQDGIYLDDLLTSDQKEIDPKLASMYLENRHFDRKHNSIENLTVDTNKANACQSAQQKLSASTEDDGYCSKPSSFVSTNHAQRISRRLNQMKQSEFLTNMSISLCGKGSDTQPNVSDDEFERAKLVYEDFVKNPELLFSRKLVIKLNGNYYKYNVAIPYVISSLLFRVPLSEYVTNKLCSQYKCKDIRCEPSSMPQIIQPAPFSTSNDSSSSNAGVGSWFSWRRAASAEPMPVTNLHIENSLLKPSIISAGSVKSGNLNRVYGSAQYLSRSSFDERDAMSDGELDHFATKSSRYRKTLFLTSDQLKSLNLRRDKSNHTSFSVTTKYQGTCTCECYIYLWKWDDKMVISDVDGTITISDVLGHLMPIIGRQWEHENVASLFSSISENGYKIVYLTARAIGQSQRTKDYLRSIKQHGQSLPDGPLQMSPVSLLSAFHREVIEKTPEIFKMKCLKDLRSTFPTNVNPLYAGFGNRPNDEVAYRSSGIPTHRIFTINPTGSVSFLDNRLRSSYHHISEIMDHVFPPLYFTSTTECRRKSVFTSPDQFSNFSYWRQQPTDVEIDMEKFDNSKDGKLKAKPTTKIVPKSRKNGIVGIP